jgi:stage II sporulation SpoE-like protein
MTGGKGLRPPRRASVRLFVPTLSAAPRRYGSIAALARVLPTRQLIPFWLAIGVTFAAFGFLLDVMARGRYAPLALLLSVVVTGTVPVGLVWARMTSRRRTFVALAVCYSLYMLLASRAFRGLPAAPPGRLFLDGVGATFTLMGGYLLFIHFINSSASRYLRARTEIELAREIHRVLVPPVDRRIGDVEFYGWSFASGDVGGDLVDVVEHDGGWLGYVADVSGHGVASGVVMGMFKSALRARILSGTGLAALLGDLNEILIPLKPPNSFITIGAIRGCGSKIECAVAGHHPVLRVRGTQVEEITPPQLAVGMFPAVTFDAQMVDWEPRDLLALVTDGLVEVFDSDDRELGLAWAGRVLAAHHHQPLAEIAERLLTGARAHGPQLDDQTVLLIRRLEPWQTPLSCSVRALQLGPSAPALE